MKITNAWDSGEAARVYSAALGQQMTDQELKDAIAFYSSPEGRRANAAVAAASAAMGDYVNGRVVAAMQGAMRELGPKVQELVRKYPAVEPP